MLKVYFLILVSYLNICISSLTLPDGYLSRPLLQGKQYSCCNLKPYKDHRDLPVIYCFHGSPKVVQHTFQTVSALIDLSSEQYDLYEGTSEAEVWDQFEAHRSSWSFNFLSFRRKDIRLNPFNTTCLGIRTSQDYKIQLHIVDVDSLKVALFVLGFLLFFLSPSLANNPLFYYLTGISIGMIASVLILFYFVLKLLPLKKPAMVGMIAGGSTIAIYLFQTFYDNILVILVAYQEYVIGYLLLSALVSFVVCYRFGPVSNPRSINLIKWSLQLFALVLILLSSHLLEVTLTFNVVIVSLYYIPVFCWIGNAARLSKRVLLTSKSKPKLLTEEEFRVQAEVETARGLDELRVYCNSPQCKQWQTILRLKDPHRFAKFMEGKSHLSQQEVDEYEEESNQMMEQLLTDDSDED